MAHRSFDGSGLRGPRRMHEVIAHPLTMLLGDLANEALRSHSSNMRSMAPVGARPAATKKPAIEWTRGRISVMLATTATGAMLPASRKNLLPPLI